MHWSTSLHYLYGILTNLDHFTHLIANLDHFSYPTHNIYNTVTLLVNTDRIIKPGSSRFSLATSLQKWIKLITNVDHGMTPSSDWLSNLQNWINLPAFNYKSGSLCPRTTQWSDWPALITNIHWLGPFWAQNLIGSKISDLIWLGPSKLLLGPNTFHWSLSSQTRGHPSGHKFETFRCWSQIR